MLGAIRIMEATMGIRGHGRPRPKQNPIVNNVRPEVIQTPAKVKRVRSVVNIEAEQRYREKKAAEKKAHKQADSFQEFWAASLKGGNAGKIAAWKTRQERVFDLMWYIEKHVNGTYDASPERDATLPEDKQEYVKVEDGDKDLREDLAEYGECSRALLQAGKFWKNPARLKLYSGDDANSVFARFGLLIAVPTDVVRKWDQFLREYRNQQAVPQPEEYVTLACLCGTQISVHTSTATNYLASDTEYRCPKCSDKSADIVDKYGRIDV